MIASATKSGIRGFLQHIFLKCQISGDESLEPSTFCQMMSSPGHGRIHSAIRFRITHMTIILRDLMRYGCVIMFIHGALTCLLYDEIFLKKRKEARVFI